MAHLKSIIVWSWLQYITFTSNSLVRLKSSTNTRTTAASFLFFFQIPVNAVSASLNQEREMYVVTRRQVVYGPGKFISSGKVSTSVWYLSLFKSFDSSKIFVQTGWLFFPFPFLLWSLWFIDGSSSFLLGVPVCNGALINKEWVITAAHCFFSKTWRPIVRPASR